MILPHKYNLCRIIVLCLIWFSHHKSEKNNNINMQLFFQKDNRWTQDVSCFSGSICNVGQTLSKANVFLSGDRVKYAKYKHITLYRHVIGFVHKLFNVLPFLHSTSLLLFLSLIIDPFLETFPRKPTKCADFLITAPKFANLYAFRDAFLFSR